MKEIDDFNRQSHDNFKEAEAKRLEEGRQAYEQKQAAMYEVEQKVQMRAGEQREVEGPTRTFYRK